MKRLFTILVVATLLASAFAMPVNAQNVTNEINDVEIIINDDVSAETKEKIEKYFSSEHLVTGNSTSTYGLTCTLFGHKIEGTVVSAITHKVRATAPRCKKETYNYEACTRCDYETSELIATEYIYCCA